MWCDVLWWLFRTNEIFSLNNLPVFEFELGLEPAQSSLHDAADADDDDDGDD